jgi:prepilin-type N-terminal cleavage/methylation domain-containing protein/prepilin-type processing-associated H-X9-DG protein
MMPGWNPPCIPVFGGALEDLMGTRRPGFTFIELLVVVAIIAVLIGILLPALGSARDVSKSLKCLANVRSVSQGIAMYCDQNRETYPYWSGWQVRGGDGTGDDSQGLGWSELVEPMLSSVEAYQDPARDKRVAPVAYFLQSRYAYALTRQMFTSVNAARVAFASQYVVAGDANQPILFMSPYGSSPHRQPDWDTDDARWPSVFFDRDEIVPHKGASNLVFSDGHAGGFKKFEPSKMTWHGTKMADWSGAGSGG